MYYNKTKTLLGLSGGFNLIDLLHHGHIAHADRNGEIKLTLSPRSLQLDLVSCVRAVRGEDNLSSPLTAPSNIFTSLTS